LSCDAAGQRPAGPLVMAPVNHSPARNKKTTTALRISIPSVSHVFTNSRPTLTTSLTTLT